MNDAIFIHGNGVNDCYGRGRGRRKNKQKSGDIKDLKCMMYAVREGFQTAPVRTINVEVLLWARQTDGGWCGDKVVVVVVVAITLA